MYYKCAYYEKIFEHHIQSYINDVFVLNAIAVGSRFEDCSFTYGILRWVHVEDNLYIISQFYLTLKLLNS